MTQFQVERLNKISGMRRYPKWFSEQEVSMIMRQLASCKDYWKTKGYKAWGEFFKFRDLTLIATIFILALRPNEACSLKFTDFDWQHSLLRIRGETNKTKKDAPPIPVPKMLLNIYSQYFKFPRRRFWRGSKYLFPSFMNDHISSGTLKTIMREKVLKPLGMWEVPDGPIGKQRTIYKLRHARAVQLLNKQIRETGKPDIHAVANFLRHADIRSTMAYLHTDEQYQNYLRKQVEL